jgi:putative addiction module antidote
MFVLKLRKIGKSVGFILPKEMLARLRAKEGQQLFAIETQNGYSLAVLNEKAQGQIKAGKELMDRCDDVFVQLAKQESSDSDQH